MQSLEEKVKQLPPELQKEVEEFVEFLLEKKAHTCGKKLRQDWAGWRDYHMGNVPTRELGYRNPIYHQRRCLIRNRLQVRRKLHTRTSF